MIDLFEIAAMEGIWYLQQVQTDEALIGTWKNHHERTVDGTLIWMEYVNKGVTRQGDEVVMEFSMFIRNTSEMEPARELKAILRDQIKTYHQRAWVDCGRNISSRITTLTFSAEGDADKISIILGMLRASICRQTVEA